MYVLILSVEISLTVCTGFGLEGVYSITNVGCVLVSGVAALGLKFSITAVLSFTLISLDGIVLGELIPSEISQTGVVVAPTVQIQSK